MPLRNPFRRQTEAPASSLRERAADLSSRLASAIHKPEATEDATFPAAPADLADACLWAIRHRAWIDQTSLVMDWPDERGDAEAARTSAVFTRAINEPSTNLREITAKAALALEDFERFTIIGPDRKQDDGTRIVHTVLREIVGVDREAGSPSLLAPDRDLTTAILDGWRAWGAKQDIADDTVQSEADARRRALIHAAMALPATPENITVKALACAWMEWVETERPGQPRDAYSPADRLVYDLHTAIMARGAHENPQPATAQPRGIDLVSRIDFAAATMSELLHIRSIAEHVGSTAYAHHQGTRCEGGRNAFGFRLDNDLGKLMVSLGDALTEVESAADAEARRRMPSVEGDRQARLLMLAPAAIDNDEPDEIEAFALELLAYAAAERAKG